MNSLKHLAVLVISAVSLNGCTFGESTPIDDELNPIEATRPNIVLILADDLGWTDMSSNLTNLGNGSTFYETPTIDMLANTGLSFTHAYALQNCAPTRAALVSGQFAPGRQNGVYNVGSLDRANELTEGFGDLPIIPAIQANEIDPVGVSIFEALSSSGYTTAWIGKNHGTGETADLGIHHGVDFNRAVKKLVRATVNGVSTESTYYALNDDTSGWKFEIPELAPYALPYDQDYIDFVLQPVANGNDPSVLLGTAKHLTDALTDVAVDYIATESATPAPFLLYLPFHAIHVEVSPRADLETKYEIKWAEEVAAGTLDSRARDPRYAGFIEQLDQNVARILNALEDPDGNGEPSDSIVEDTLVIFLSDNGDAGNLIDTLRSKKGTYYEGGLRVPFISNWPGVIAPQTTSDQPIHVVDLYPTLAKLAGAVLPDPEIHSLDGESFASILADHSSKLIRDSLYWHFPGYMDIRQRPNSLIQKRVGEDYYKLFYYYESGRYEMYNISQDLGEATDLLANDPTEADQRIAESANTDLREWLIARNAVTGTWAATNDPVPYPPATIDFNAQSFIKVRYSGRDSEAILFDLGTSGSRVSHSDSLNLAGKALEITDPQDLTADLSTSNGPSVVANDSSCIPNGDLCFAQERQDDETEVPGLGRVALMFLILMLVVPGTHLLGVRPRIN